MFSFHVFGMHLAVLLLYMVIFPSHVYGNPVKVEISLNQFNLYSITQRETSSLTITSDQANRIFESVCKNHKIDLTKVETSHSIVV